MCLCHIALFVVLLVFLQVQTLTANYFKRPQVKVTSGEIKHGISIDDVLKLPHLIGNSWLLSWAFHWPSLTFKITSCGDACGSFTVCFESHIILTFFCFWGFSWLELELTTRRCPKHSLKAQSTFLQDNTPSSASPSAWVGWTLGEDPLFNVLFL